MNEFSPETIEAEIATLSTMIEEKRRALESMKGISVDSPEVKLADRETIKSFIEEIHNDSGGNEGAPVVNVTGTIQNTVQQNSGGNKSYLDSLADDVVSTVNSLISLVPTKGIKATLKEAKKNDPIVIDAFHDVLVEKLYEELKQRKIV